MQIKVNVRKKHLYITAGLLVFLLGIGVFAAAAPKVFHTLLYVDKLQLYSSTAQGGKIEVENGMKIKGDLEITGSINAPSGNIDADTIRGEKKCTTVTASGYKDTSNTWKKSCNNLDMKGLCDDEDGCEIRWVGRHLTSDTEEVRICTGYLIMDDNRRTSSATADTNIYINGYLDDETQWTTRNKDDGLNEVLSCNGWMWIHDHQPTDCGGASSPTEHGVKTMLTFRTHENVASTWKICD